MEWYLLVWTNGISVQRQIQWTGQLSLLPDDLKAVQAGEARAFRLDWDATGDYAGEFATYLEYICGDQGWGWMEIEKDG